MATPGCRKAELYAWSPADSGPPQLLEMNFAPSATAESSAAANSAMLGSYDPGMLEWSKLASTSMIRQFGQTAETMSRSRDSSTSHCPVGSAIGSGLAFPFWLTFTRQPAPVAALQAGRPHSLR